jgi:hypothetical protein
MLLENVTSTLIFRKKRILQMTFFFGQRLRNHFPVNNWSNGWKITDSSANYGVRFLPDYLEIAGFLILSVSFFILFIKALKRA